MTVMQVKVNVVFAVFWHLTMHEDWSKIQRNDYTANFLKQYCLARFNVADLGLFSVIKPCLSNPCQNGGSCNDNSDGTYICTCQSGFTGDMCQKR